MHPSSNRLIRVVLSILVLSFIIISCTSVFYLDGPQGRKCKASCKTFASDGKSCVDWSETASDACVGKYTAVYTCCTNYGSCPMAYAGAKGYGCTCYFPDPYYGQVAINGVACDDN